MISKDHSHIVSVEKQNVDLPREQRGKHARGAAGCWMDSGVEFRVSNNSGAEPCTTQSAEEQQVQGDSEGGRDPPSPPSLSLSFPCPPLSCLVLCVPWFLNEQKRYP